MQQADYIQNKCYICRKKNTEVTEFEIINKNRVPNSRKSLEDVILHVAIQMKMVLKVPAKAELCRTCLQDLIEYDECVLRLLTVQNRLMQMMEQWASSPIHDDAVPADTNAANLVPADEATPKEPNDDEQMCSIEVERLENLDVPSDPFIIDEDDESPNISYDTDIKGEESETTEEEQNITARPVRPTATCTHCNKVFENKSRLKHHVEQEHKRKERRTCSVCGITVKDEEYLELHMNLHEGKTENDCRYCSKRYTRKVNVIRHMQKHWDKKKFQCEKCGLRFSETMMLYNHKMQHEAEEQPPICTICNLSFKTKRTYKGHMMTHRADRPRYICQHCGKIFMEKYTLNVHLRVHGDYFTDMENQSSSLGESDDGLHGQYSCIICSCEFENEDLYNQHMERQHDIILKAYNQFFLC